ncbi:GNAT family N-acetyltransferase [Vallitalea guaymasensis]|uniref:GNAT family N-acetyltransferase n=1 Tax=Vallitalea guaymasensis TaxID=1185412 RepID=A0A8J8MCX3_9FIRM|nr:GNAT family N-acetyltransferase [Vallitalea guaymasensis]QUH30606.1 GNAT family N-acetyltransferase [Vallitalea guaymasensis]
MADMLVNLLHIEDYHNELERLEKEDIKIFRALAPDKYRIVEWVKEHSSINAAGECDVCFSNNPISCFIAAKGSEIIGYACYNATAPDFFGPTRVSEEYRGKGIGKALLLRSLNALKDEGYIYAIIGGIGPANFYEKCVNAVLIDSSKEYSVYEHFLAGIEKQNK